MKPFKIGDKDNSMLRSDIDIDEDPNQNGVIMELDDDEEVDTKEQ